MRRYAGRAIALTQCYVFSGEARAREIETICLEFTSLCGGEGLLRQNRSKERQGRGCLVSRAMEFLNGRTVYGKKKNGYGIRSREKKRLPLPSTDQSGNRQSVTASMFDSVRIRSSKPWIRLKADYRGGQRSKFSLRRCFPGFCFSFVVTDL